MRANDIRVLERRVLELSADIRAIERDMEHADPKLRETYGMRLKDIQARRRHIQDRLAELHLQQAMEWEKSDFATGVERVLDRIGRGLDKVTSRRHSAPRH
jgi:hypothetical protein